MPTRMEFWILDALGDGAIRSPKQMVLVANGWIRESTTVSQYLPAMRCAGWIEKVERGQYRITEEGRAELARAWEERA